MALHCITSGSSILALTALKRTKVAHMCSFMCVQVTNPLRPISTTFMTTSQRFLLIMSFSEVEPKLIDEVCCKATYTTVEHLLYLVLALYMPGEMVTSVGAVGTLLTHVPLLNYRIRFNVYQCLFSTAVTFCGLTMVRETMSL